jgi:hypothetical protein
VPPHVWKTLKLVTLAAVFMTAGAASWEWWEHWAAANARQRVVMTTMVRALAHETGEAGMDTWRRVAAQHPGLVENIVLMTHGQAEEAIDALTDELAELKMAKRYNRRDD